MWKFNADMATSRVHYDEYWWEFQARNGDGASLVHVHTNRCPKPLCVIPAKAGIQGFERIFWIPAFAGMTDWKVVTFLCGAVLRSC